MVAAAITAKSACMPATRNGKSVSRAKRISAGSWWGCHWPTSALALDIAPSNTTGKTIDLNTMESPGW
jgi:hypothetical protein